MVMNADMKRVVEQQRLGFVATVCPDGTPNLSPKGTLSVLDDDHLGFADLRSPGTIANLRANPAIEVNVVDPIIRKGYRFKGRAELLESGSEFERLVAFFGDRGLPEAPRRIRVIVRIRVDQARPLVSPGYDWIADEASMRAHWIQIHLGEDAP